MGERQFSDYLKDATHATKMVGLLSFTAVSDETDQREARRLAKRVEALTQKLTGSIVDSIGRLPEDEDGDTPAITTLKQYEHDFHEWRRTATDSDKIRLALWMLEEVDLLDEDGDVMKALHERDKRCRYRNNKGQLHECPRCCEGKVKQRECKRCHGLGYLVQPTPPDDGEYDMTREGHRALNEGKTWTIEDERRVLVETYGHKDEDHAIKHAWAPERAK
jgi:hypothetical protein